MTTSDPATPSNQSAAAPFPAPPPAPPPGRGRRSAISRLLMAILLLMLAMLLLLGAAVYTALATDWGTRTAWRAATGALAGKLSGKLVSGNLADGLVLHDLQYRDAERSLALDRFAGAWRLSLSPAFLTIDHVRLGRLELTLLPTPPKPLRAPDDIRLPLAFELKQLNLKELLLHRPDGVTRISDLQASARSDRVHHQVQLDHVTTPYGVAQGALRLTGTAPFAVDGTVRLMSVFDQQRYVVDGTLSGSLRGLGLSLQAGGGKLAGTADIVASPFDPVPLQQVRLALQHFDPRMFKAAAPQADLALQATLVPVPAPGPVPVPAPASGAGPGQVPQQIPQQVPQQVPQTGQLVVGGPVVITNAAPGRLDQGRLPLVAARAEVSLDASRQQLRSLELSLLGNATLSGTGAIGAGGQGDFALRVAGLDLHALHGALLPTHLDGPVDLKLRPNAQDLVLQLRSDTLSIEADVRADAAQVVLQSAQLQAGTSQLRLSGMMARDAQSGFAVKGAFKDFDPAAFLARTRTSAPAPDAASGKLDKSGKPGKLSKPAAAPVHARINMDFDATGTLQPELAARLGFAIHDSSYDRLPLTGGGKVQVRGKRLLASDAKLSIAGNEAVIKGSFGAVSDRLDVHIDAPSLARLGFGLAGQVQVDARLGGGLDQPVIDASWRARDVVAGQHRLATLTGQAHIDGLPGRNPDARLALTLDARGVLGGPAALDQLSARIDGSFARHTIDFKANGRLSGQPLALTVAAQGNLSQTPGLSWAGVVRTLDNRGVPRLAIGAPLALKVAADQLELGATRLTVGPAEIDLKGFQFRPGTLRSQGAFTALRLADVLALQSKFTGVAPPLSTSLVLDGSWNLDIGASTARGFAQIARRSGDVVVATPFGANALGLGTLQLRADLSGERMHLDSRIQASRIGTLAARGDIGLLRSADPGPLGLTSIGPGSTLAGSLEGALPALRNFASLTGPSIALDGSVSLALQAAGSLGKPVVSGNLNGDRLALTLFDQGVRLRDGTARIALNNNAVELREVVFHGGSGTLKATGRIPLDQSDTGLAALIVADRLQLLNDPSRRLMLSGQARMANIGQQLNVTGRFRVDHGLFSLPEKSAPQLSDDVVIVRPGATPKPAAGQVRPAPQRTAATSVTPTLLPPKVNLVIDLGDDFRFKGAGADIFLAGAFDIRSAANQPPQAFGTVRVVSGAYEAFGARLAIERGLITFQGPFDNPSINLLAMRRNQAVPAGVQVTGNVRQPRVELVSEPSLSEDQKLSWLVFGRGDSGGGGTGASGGGIAQAKGAVQSAALGLVNKFGGSRLAENVGLDKLSIGASEYRSGSGQVVNLGKELSKRLFIGYEQGLAGAESAVKLTYELTQHWSLILRGGAVAGLDVNYSRRFDR